MTDNRKFEIETDVELPGTPERVWQAVTKDTPAWMFPHGSVAGREDHRGIPQPPCVPHGRPGWMVQPVGAHP